jgi:hypothetical protein
VIVSRFVIADNWFVVEFLCAGVRVLERAATDAERSAVLERMICHGLISLN